MKFISCKKAVCIKDHKTGQKCNLNSLFIGNVEDWVTKTDYFNDLVNDGTITFVGSSQDKDLYKADEVSNQKKVETEKVAKVKRENDKKNAIPGKTSSLD